MDKTGGIFVHARRHIRDFPAGNLDVTCLRRRHSSRHMVQERRHDDLTLTSPLQRHLSQERVLRGRWRGDGFCQQRRKRRVLLDQNANDLTAQFGHFTHCLKSRNGGNRDLFAEEVLKAEGGGRGRVEIGAEQTEQRQGVGGGVAPQQQALTTLAQFWL